MMPNTSVSPAAIRKSMTPSCRPFSACSRTRITGAQNKGARRATAPLPRSVRQRLPLHSTFLIVGVLVVLEDGLLDLHLLLAARALHRAQEVEVLDREVVHVVRVGPARGPVVRLPHRGDHALLV